MLNPNYQSKKGWAGKAKKWQIAAIFASVTALVAGVFLIEGKPKDTVAAATTACTAVVPTKKPADLPKPGILIKANTNYRLTLKTNCGNIVIDLNSKAPAAINSLIYLNSKKYFNKNVCHSLESKMAYTLHCGNPSGVDGDGPGYHYNVENLPVPFADSYGSYAIYPKGTVAMYNTGPNTSGSEFFISYDRSRIPSVYTIVGKVISGINIVEDAGREGTVDGNFVGEPKKQIQILSTTLTVKPPKVAVKKK